MKIAGILDRADTANTKASSRLISMQKSMHHYHLMATEISSVGKTQTQGTEFLTERYFRLYYKWQSL